MTSATEGICAADVVGRIERLARFSAAGPVVTHRRMASGAAHDTMIFAQSGIPALLLFVPSRGGVSHSPDESTSDADLNAGVRFTDALCRRLAAHPPA